MKDGNGINLCSVYPANNPNTSYNSKLPNIYVGIVGWIYRTKIDPISIHPCFLTFLSNGHHFMDVFSSLVLGLFFSLSLFMVLCMYVCMYVCINTRVQCMQGQMKKFLEYV